MIKLRHVGDVDKTFAGKQRPARSPIRTADTAAQSLGERLGDAAKAHGAEQFAVAKRQRAISGVAESVGFFQYHIEDGGKLTRRRIDDLQYLGSRGLLLESFLQVARSVAQLVEQPDVLDCDNGLIGEGLEEADLRLGEWGDLTPRYCDRTDWIAIVKNRYGQPGTHPRPDGAAKPVLGVSGSVGDVYGFPRQDRAPGRAFPAWRARIIALNSLRLLNCPAVMRCEMDQRAIEPRNGATRRACENRGAGSDRIERRLQIGRRPGDDAEDFGGCGLPLQRLARLCQQPRVLHRND